MPPPRKKDRLRGSLSPMREQFPPIETLCGGQAELPGKSRPNEGSKTVPGGGQDCAQAAPMGERRAWGFWCREGAALGTRWDRGGTPGRKTVPGGGQDCAQAAPMGERRAMEHVWCREVTARAARRGRGHARAQKQPPAGAGGCLDAGYECYLPRAIRVIWMHRVGSTARPRIMPS